MARGLPPLASDGGGAHERVTLSFGFFNGRRPPEANAQPPKQSEWQVAFDVLARNGDSCSFEPVTALTRHLLSVEPTAHGGLLAALRTGVSTVAELLPLVGAVAAVAAAAVGVWYSGERGTSF